MSDTGPTDDGWGVSDDYDITEFYTRASDGRGHSDMTKVKIKPDLAGELSAFVALGIIPEYRTPQDLIRDAIVHRLHWLNLHIDDPRIRVRLDDMIRRLTIEETTQRYIALVDSFEEYLTRAREVCERALRWNDQLGVKAFLDDVAEYAANTREPYASKLREVVAYYRSRLNLEELEPEVPLDGGLGPTEEEA